MGKQYFDLMQFFEGYVRNHRRLNLSSLHNRSMFTQREIAHFAELGELLGFDVFVEDAKFDQKKGRSRPMDLSWWKWGAADFDHYAYLALHLERENVWNKDIETIEKLFSKTAEGYVPHNVIGIQHLESAERIPVLNRLVAKRNAEQQSAALMIYRYKDSGLTDGCMRVSAHFFAADGSKKKKEAVAKLDESGYWFMSYEEEYQAFQNQTLAN